ncbi:peptidoglycan DD-metalloendopeptidase family protein [Nitrincola sp. MINF-07-Sa-05]|uniref:peptidoglycan DD-metalloendopeptidase family protein n=1 Tax=Nitrincola salilacus TaxID=3400273 RepID=UPI003917B8BF
MHLGGLSVATVTVLVALVWPAQGEGVQESVTIKSSQHGTSGRQTNLSHSPNINNSSDLQRVAPAQPKQASLEEPVEFASEPNTPALSDDTAQEPSTELLSDFPDGPMIDQLVEEEAVAATPSEFSFTIESGDTLGSLFDKAQVGQAAMHHILAADQSLLALDTLRPGNVLTFRMNETTGLLDEMELYIHAGNRIHYQRVSDNAFEYQEVIDDGEWEHQIVSGEIHGSFYVSAIKEGLTKSEIAEISDLFKEQLDFARQIQAGDVFQVVRTSQRVGDEYTGQSRIEAVRLLQNKRNYTAFLFDDGNYYDANGESLARAFMRNPTNSRYRISSSFNPRRLHPVTGRVSPHNGTDYAMPIGTPVLTTGDGVVTRVENHPYAGKYVEISHGSQYKTRYLHLDRFLVKRGQSVKRGQRIGLSGNTGRTTGPHLHFELHVNGRPVNAMTANIPLATSVPKEQLASFNERVSQMVSMIEGDQEQRLAMR